MPRTIRFTVAGVLLALFIFGATRLEISTDASSAMLPTDKLFVDRYQDFLDRFPSDQGAIIVFKDLFCTLEGWDLILELEKEVSNIPSVSRTLSVGSPNIKYLQADFASVDLADFKDVEFSTGEARCAAAATYRPFQGVFVSSDYDVALYLLTDTVIDAVSLSDQLAVIVDKYKPQAKDLGGRIVLSGEPVMSAEVSKVVAKDNIFVVITIALMLGALYFITRSLATVLSALVLCLFVLAVTYGSMGFLGLTLTPATSLVVFLLLPLSTAFVIHAHGYHVRQHGASLPVNSSKLPFVLAGLTTAVGFASTGLTPAHDIQLLAIMGIIGVIAATLGLFLLVFPILEMRTDHTYAYEVSVPVRILSNPSIGYLFLILLVCVTTIGLSKVNANYSPTKYLPDSNEIRADFIEVGESFGRMSIPLIIEVDDANNPQSWVDLQLLVQLLMEKYDEGFHVTWFYDHLSEVSKAFTLDEHGRSQNFPTTSAQFQQFSLLFDSRDLEVFMDDDRERILMMLHVPFEGSAEYFALKDVVYTFLSQNGISGYFIGRVSAFFETGHRVGPDTLRGLVIGAVFVFLLLWVLFRSFNLAVVGILVNSLPVLAGIASLGILGIDIDMGSSIVAAIAFGIVLDDSTHLIGRVKELVSNGYDPHTSVFLALRELTTPIVNTTVAICMGFSVLLFAELKPFNEFSIVILITLVTALLTDLFVLPLLVRKFFKDPLKAP